MSESEKKPPTDTVAPLAALLFGWTRAPGIGPSILGGIAIAGAGLVAAEYMRPRSGLQLPFEGTPGFYAALGAGAVLATLMVASLLRWLVEREHPYADEAQAPAKPDDGGAPPA